MQLGFVDREIEKQIHHRYKISETKNSRLQFAEVPSKAEDLTFFADMVMTSHYRCDISILNSLHIFLPLCTDNDTQHRHIVLK